MMVMTTPVTTSGKKRSRRVNTGAMKKAMTLDSSSAPKMARSPVVPPPCDIPMASMVDTAANEVPCTIGCRAPIFHTPRVCSRVAMPDMNSPADTR